MTHAYEFEIDEFIDGELFHCDAMLINGSIRFFMGGLGGTGLAKFFEGKPIGSIPVNDQLIFDKLKKICKTVLTKLNAPSGAYHLEAFLEPKSQEFIFLEVGARTGGALLTRVYEKLFDLNIEETNYLIQMNLIDEVKIAQKNICAGFINFPTINGTVANLHKPNVNIEHEFIEFVARGDELEQAQNLLDISCSVIFWDNSYQKVEETFEFLKNYNPLVISQTSPRQN